MCVGGWVGRCGCGCACVFCILVFFHCLYIKNDVDMLIFRTSDTDLINQMAI